MPRRPRSLIGAVAAVALAVMIPVTAPSSASHATVPADADSAAGTVRVIAAEAAGPEEAASARVSAMSTREKAASVVMGHIPTTDPARLTQYMGGSGIGGFILMGANIPSSEDELRALTRSLSTDPALPPLIAVDQEGGDVSRLPWDRFPSALTLKALPPDASRDAFAGRAALVLRAGIGVNFGIVADVTADPASFIYRRALGTNAQEGAARVAAAVAGEKTAAISTLKHFPGHGAVGGDSHVSIPSTGMSKDAWLASDAVPFRSGIEAGAPILMFGHLAYTSVDPAPASLSAEWHRIAREELGFDGVTLTDDLGMLQASGVPAYADPVANAVAAIAAGNDMVLAVVYSNADTAARMADGIAAAVDGGTLPAERLDEAATRVMRLRLQLAADGRGMMPCAQCAPAG
jgi:beta-N-acetylhexosaminidase